VRKMAKESSKIMQRKIRKFPNFGLCVRDICKCFTALCKQIITVCPIIVTVSTKNAIELPITIFVRAKVSNGIAHCCNYALLTRQKKRNCNRFVKS